MKFPPVDVKMFFA